MRSRKKKLSPEEKAELQAIQAHDSLIALGYAEEIEPLRLPNKRGRLGIVFASIAAILYGISGFIFGLQINAPIDTGGFFFHFFDSLTICALIAAAISLCCACLGMMKKYGSRVTPIVAFTVLLTAPVVLHILGVIFGMIIP
jgi:hypothetical protein